MQFELPGTTPVRRERIAVRERQLVYRQAGDATAHDRLPPGGYGGGLYRPDQGHPGGRLRADRRVSSGAAAGEKEFQWPADGAVVNRTALGGKGPRLAPFPASLPSDATAVGPTASSATSPPRPAAPGSRGGSAGAR